MATRMLRRPVAYEEARAPSDRLDDSEDDERDALRSPTTSERGKINAGAFSKSNRLNVRPTLSRSCLRPSTDSDPCVRLPPSPSPSSLVSLPCPSLRSDLLPTQILTVARAVTPPTPPSTLRTSRPRPPAIHPPSLTLPRPATPARTRPRWTSRRSPRPHTRP